MYRFSTALAVVFLLAGFMSQAAEPQIDAPFTLRVGESVTIDGLMVGFNGIDSDSRCPRSVDCIWEGDAAAGMWARPDSRDITSFVLHTAGGFARTQDIGRYRVTLLGVNPYPIDPGVIDPAQYVIVVAVTSVDEATPTLPTTWGSIKALYDGPR